MNGLVQGYSTASPIYFLSVQVITPGQIQTMCKKCWYLIHKLFLTIKSFLFWKLLSPSYVSFLMWRWWLKQSGFWIRLKFSCFSHLLSFFGKLLRNAKFKEFECCCNSRFQFHLLHDITILRYNLYSNFIDKPLSKAHIASWLLLDSWQDMTVNLK